MDGKKKTSESVSKEADTKLNLLYIIKTTSKAFIIHIMRRHSLEQILTTGKMNGKRARGRQREKIWDEPGRWTGGGKGMDLIVKFEDRET